MLIGHLYAATIYMVNENIMKFLMLLVMALALQSCSDDSVQSQPESERADDIVSSSTYSKLLIEVDWVEGAQPQDIDSDVTSFLNELLDKPNGIQIKRDQELSSKGVDHVWTFEEMDELLRDNQTLETGADQTAIHIVFLDGAYEGNEANSVVLGLAWGRRIAIFKDTIRSACERPLLGERLCKDAELAITLHELGHVIGLVNNGVPLTSDHHDEEHGAHCTNEDCLMYWEYEGVKLIDALSSRFSLDPNAKIFDFDQACRDDLTAIK